MLKLLSTLSFFTKAKCVTNSWVWVLLRVVGTGLVKGNCFVSSKHLGKTFILRFANDLGCFCNTWESFFFFIEICKHLGCFWNTWRKLLSYWDLQSLWTYILGVFLRVRWAGWKLLSYWDLQSLWTYILGVFLRVRWAGWVTVGAAGCLYCKTGIWFACIPHFRGGVVNA